MKQPTRYRPMMAVSIAPALLAAIDKLTRVTGEPRSHAVERLLWASLSREPRSGVALRSRLAEAALLRFLGERDAGKRRPGRRPAGEQR